MVFIISDAYNAAKYARKSHEFFVNSAQIERIDFCSDIPLFEAGINNTIVHFTKASPHADHYPVRVRRWGETRDDFELNAEVQSTTRQSDFGVALFNKEETGVTMKGALTLGMVCYISKGMVIHADERRHLGAFKTEDLISPTKDKLHPKPFIQGRDILKWAPSRIEYLEWDTKRAPTMFRRPTFPELYAVPEKLITMDIGGRVLRAVYDNDQLLHNHSASSFVPWHYLKGVRNKSIQKTAKYRHEVKQDEVPPATIREDLEELSQQFRAKYLVAVMNSTFARGFVNKQRRSKINIYPNDWKPLPVPLASAEEQAKVISLVDEILALYAKHGYPLSPEAQARLQELEKEIDKKVAELYEHHNT
jgi:hypothetical protein